MCDRCQWEEYAAECRALAIEIRRTSGVCDRYQRVAELGARLQACEHLRPQDREKLHGLRAAHADAVSREP